MKTVMLCAICSVSAGNCSQDCAYCTQSVKSQVDIEKFELKNIEQIIKEAKIAAANHALGFCLVTSGRKLGEGKKLEHIAKAARAVHEALPELMLIACNGEASYEALCELKKAGVFSYNHNLETSREFFPKICTTHSWEDRFETNLNAKRAGLMLCTGGIYGLGESEDDRKSFRKSLAELSPFTSTVNFFIPHEKLPIKREKMSADEAFGIIADTKAALPEARIMIAGGREKILGERQYEIFEHGADAIVIGDYLTTRGEKPCDDIVNLEKMGFEFAKICH
ncbi:MAG: biotin synthase [Campylobacter sp.]|nr:biotin synthase [Campylobacter sp.]